MISVLYLPGQGRKRARSTRLALSSTGAGYSRAAGPRRHAAVHVAARRECPPRHGGAAALQCRRNTGGDRGCDRALARTRSPDREGVRGRDALGVQMRRQSLRQVTAHTEPLLLLPSAPIRTLRRPARQHATPHGSARDAGELQGRALSLRALLGAERREGARVPTSPAPGDAAIQTALHALEADHRCKGAEAAVVETQDVWSEHPCRAVEPGGHRRLVWPRGRQAHVRLSRITRALHNSFSVKGVPPALMDAAVSPAQREEPSPRSAFGMRRSTADARPTSRLMQRRRLLHERVSLAVCPLARLPAALTPSELCHAAR